MGVAAPRKPSHQAVAPQQVSDTLPAPSHHQSQPFETSYTLSSVTETATISKAAPILPTKLLATLETPTSFSAPVLAATSSPSSSHSSAIALGIVFGVFFGTIIFSFIIWRFCHRGSSTPKSKSSASPRPSSSTAKAITAMPVKYLSTMRYPQRPTPVRVKSGDRKERAVPPVREAEKVHTAQVKVPVVKVIQSNVPPRPPSSQRDSSSHPGSHGARRTHHRRDTSAPRLHPGRQAVVDVSSPAAEKDDDDDHDFHSNDERSRHTWNPNSTDRPHAATRERNHHQDSLYDLPPVVYIAGRASHERRSRRSHERESRDPHEHRQARQSQRRVRRSQPGSVNIVHESAPAVHAASVSEPAVPTSTRRYQPPRYDSGSSVTSSSGLSDNLGEEPPALTPSSSSSSSSSSEGRGSWSRRRSWSQSPARVRLTIPSGVSQYLDDGDDTY